MASLCKHVSSQFCLLSRNILSGTCNNSLRSQTVRCLYSEGFLDIDGYKKRRERAAFLFKNSRENFRSKMEEVSDEYSTNIIFHRDINYMVSLSNNDPNDIDMVLKIIKKYKKQDEILRSGSFSVGTEVMRMFYHFNQPEAAFASFTDPEMDGVFDQSSSFKILMDLLFNNRMYDQVLEVFEKIKPKQQKISKHCSLMVFAAFYKLNTPESLQQAKQLWSEIQDVGEPPLRRTIYFAIALALKQKSPQFANELLTFLKHQVGSTASDLKIWMYTDLDKPENAFPILRAILNDNSIMRKKTVAKEAFDKLKEVVERSERNDIKMEFEKLEKYYIAADLVREQPLDKNLFSKIKRRRFVASSSREKGGARTRLYPSLAEIF